MRDNLKGEKQHNKILRPKHGKTKKTQKNNFVLSLKKKKIVQLIKQDLNSLSQIVSSSLLVNYRLSKREKKKKEISNDY